MNIALKFPQRLSVHQLVFFRAFFAVLFIAVHLRIRKLNLRNKNMSLLVTRGLLGTAGLYLFVMSIRAMPLGTAVTIQYLNPLFAMVISATVLKEGASVRVWSAALAAFFGIILIEKSEIHMTEGALAIGVLSAFCSGLVQNLIRKMRGDADPIVIAFYFPALTIPLSLYPTIENWISPSPLEWLSLFMSGFFAYIAQIFYTKAFQADRISRIATLSYMGPPLAVIAGWIIFGEALSLNALLGILVVLASIAWSTGQGSMRYPFIQKFFRDSKSPQDQKHP